MTMSLDLAGPDALFDIDWPAWAQYASALDSADLVVAAASLASTLTRSLSDTAGLARAADVILGLRLPVGWPIVGASELGQALAGAVTLRSHGAVRLCRPGDSEVVVVDAAVVTGVCMARASQHLTSSGAAVVAACVFDLRPDPATIPGVLELLSHCALSNQLP